LLTRVVPRQIVERDQQLAALVLNAIAQLILIKPALYAPTPKFLLEQFRDQIDMRDPSCETCWS